MIDGLPILRKACGTVGHQSLSLGGPDSLA